MGSQQLDQNYKVIPQNVYDPVGTQFVSPQAGPVSTGTDGTKYAPQVVAPSDGIKATYSAAKQGLVTAASATDIFTLTGSATKVIRVTRVEVSGVATTILDTSVELIVRTTADTGGTSTNPPAVPHDSASSPATAVAAAYTANPTINDGTSKPIRSSKVLFNLSAPAAGSESGRLIEDFGDRPAQAIVLRGATQQLAINLNGVTVQGPSIDVSVEWTEE
jgi:hypothetical protein